MDSTATAVGADVELNGHVQNSNAQLNAALEEMTLYKQELENALEDSNARLSSAEKELVEVREQWDDARARLMASSEREKKMEAQLADVQAQLEQANKELEKERQHWHEQYEAEKDMAEQLKITLAAVRLQLETDAQKHKDDTEQQCLAWVAKEKELWSLVEASRAEKMAAEVAASEREATDIAVSPEAAAAAAAAVAVAKDAMMVEPETHDFPEEEKEKQTVKTELIADGKLENGHAADEDDLKKNLTKGRDPSLFLNVDAWVSAATCGDGTTTPLAVNEDALRRNLQSALARLEGMQEIQEKWRKQVERMDEVESEWKSRLSALEQERDELLRELELLSEDLRREQELAAEAGMVAEEEWRKRQEAERSMAELQREVAKQKKVAREALMCIPRAVLDHNEFAGGLAEGSGPLVPISLTGSASGEAELGDIPLQDADALESIEQNDLSVDNQKDTREAVIESLGEEQSASEDHCAYPAPVLGASPKELVMEDAGGLKEMVPSLDGSGVQFEESSQGTHDAGRDEKQKTMNADESILRLGQELGTLRKEVLELRMKLAEVRGQLTTAEEHKRDAEVKRAFGQVCLQLVTNAKDKFEDQIAMATRHALEASQKARESDKQLFALLADISSLLKEHQVQAKNNGSTYNRYKIGKQEIDTVKEDLRQLVKIVQMKATLAEKGRQKNKTKAAADAARPRLAELRDGAAQDEEVLAELEKELDEARRRTEEAEQMQSMVAQMREKERQVRESVEKEVRAVQAKMQEAEIMKQQVEALKQTEQVLAKELAEEVKELKVKSLEAEEVEGRISALEATETVIREEMELKTQRVREIDRQFPRLMGLGLGSELPPPGLLGRKQQEELAWKDKRKVLEDLKVMKEQLIWTQSSLLKSRQRLPELIQEAKDCKRRVEEKEKETKRVQQWLKDHDAGLTAAKGAGDSSLRNSIAGTWGNWWKKKEDIEGPPPARLGTVSVSRAPVGSLLPLGSQSSDEHPEQIPRTGSSHLSSPSQAIHGLKMSSPAQSGPSAMSTDSPGPRPVVTVSPPLAPLEGQRPTDLFRAGALSEAQRVDLQQKYQHQMMLKHHQPQQLVQQHHQPGALKKDLANDFFVGSKTAGVREFHLDSASDVVPAPQRSDSKGEE